MNWPMKVFFTDDALTEEAISVFKSRMEIAGGVTHVLAAEAEFTKKLYRYAAQNTKTVDFRRERNSDQPANRLLDHGNYLAYGLAAMTLWVLGIPHGFAVMHGKTRRGALVFDVADLIKDAIVLPWSFICAMRGQRDREFRQICLQKFTEHKALDFMFDEVKRCSRLYAGGERS